jgi:FtsH-binding integral membrane protein
MEDRNTPISFSDYTVVDSGKSTRTMAKTFMANVFLWMFAALGISAFFAYLFASTPSLLQTLIDTTTGKLNILGYITMFAPLAFVLTMSFAFQRLSAPLMVGFFLAYAAVTGISLSFIFLAYTSSSIIGCFAAASAMFGIMAVMGYTTDKDLTSFGRILTMGLIGIVIASLINMFIGSDRMGYIISIVGVAVFTGLTAYDVQKLKRIGEGIEYEGASASDTKKLSIMGALTLYLDFINLFLMLLRLFGGRRD